ncbi:MAG: hypothetical protein KF767_08910 [Bdellovibrionaceae bacterium]|nr:hypothetical protein [Pseudobdellovibrionaceae bacterium]
MDELFCSPEEKGKSGMTTQHRKMLEQAQGLIDNMDRLINRTVARVRLADMSADPIISRTVAHLYTIREEMEETLEELRLEIAAKEGLPVETLRKS